MKKNLLSFVIGLLIFGVGCGYIGFEILDFDYLDKEKSGVELEKRSHTYSLNGNYYEISSEYGKIEIVENDNLEDSFILEISYPRGIIDTEIEEEKENNTRFIEIEYQENLNSEDVKNIFNSFLEDFKNKEFYNYQKTYEPKVKIYVKKENVTYLKVRNVKIEGLEL